MSALDTSQFAATYREEASELLGDLETSLLELESRPDDEDLVARVFRALHTIKGSGAMFGFNDIAAFTHALETAFDEVRQGHIPASREIVSLALEGKDLIRAMLEGDADLGKEARERVITALQQITSPAHAAPKSPPPAPKPPEEPARTYRVTFRPNHDILQDGTNPLGLFPELLELGRGEVTATTADVPKLEDIEPEHCYLSWDAIVTTSRGMGAVRDVFIFVEDRGALEVRVVDDGTETGDYKRLGEILVDRGQLSGEALDSALAARPKLGAILEEKGLASREAVAAALKEQQIVRSARADRAKAAQHDGQSVRVPAEKLDALVDLVGELVIAEARLRQVAARCDDPELFTISEDVERLSAELRDNTLNLRMVQIGSTFNRFKRLVRDLSGELSKQIELVTEGAETELDKTVIERLGDPLVHIIRNSCDHGIESPAVREASKKPATGTVTLKAYQSGPNVVIEIQDDGAGLNPEAIREKAVARGLIEADAKLSEHDLYQLIFVAGFSTASAVSALSGRGVGMDVVKRSVEALRGSIELESRRGLGTTIRIKLPLTLAIIDGLLVSVGDGRYVLPMSLVEECVEITKEGVDQAHGSHLVPVRGELVPYLRLREWFREGGDRPPIEQVAIASAEGMRLGFAVDDVIGQQQTVIKTLGKMYGDTEGLSGATILGDGTVALIVDVAGVIRTLTTSSPPPV